VRMSPAADGICHRRPAANITGAGPHRHLPAPASESP
jgi:hypothetical protein